MNLLIDGGSLIHRVYWVSQKHPFKTTSGDDIGDIYMFLNAVRGYVKLFNCTSVYVAWDKKILWPSTNFRKESFKDYKGHRDKEKAKDIYYHEDEIIRILGLLGIKNLLPRVMEADDVISWLSRKLEGPNIVVSSDLDLLQLVSKTTSFYQPYKKLFIDIKNFEEHVGLVPAGYLYYKAIKGDISDNIPGIRGFGKVRARELVQKILYQQANIQKILNNDEYQQFINNIKLMDLAEGYKIAGPEEEQEYEKQYQELSNLEPNLDGFKNVCEQYEFNKFLNQFDEWKALFSKQNSRLLTILNTF